LQRRRLLLTAPIALIGLILAALPVAAADQTVEIRSFNFMPREVEIEVGDTVSWANFDGESHTATARDGSFDTGLIGPGQTASVTFDAAGTHTYYCTPHPGMIGTVVVAEAAPAGEPSGAATGEPSDAPEATQPATDRLGSQGDRAPALPWVLVVSLAVTGLAVLIVLRLGSRLRFVRGDRET